MKKFILISLGFVSVFVLSGCSGVGAGESDRVVVTSSHDVHISGNRDSAAEVADESEPIDNTSNDSIKVDILDLDDGYTVEGFSSFGNGVTLRFYEGRYSYERTDEYGVVRESFSGYFALHNGAIKIYFGDNDGGGYAIETNNGLLEEGYFYNIIGVRDDITITDIYRSNSL